MSGVNLQAIYDRLASAPKYHPLSANTFADWSMEAGDIVTVSRDGTNYSSPVGTMTMRWTGKQQIQISSEGSRERDPISRVSARKYATGGGGTSGIRANQSLYYEMIDQDRELRGVISATAESLTVDYTKRISAKGIELEGKIDASAERLTIDYTKKIDDKGVEMEGKISASAERLTIDYTDKIGKVESNFDQRAGQIELSVSNLDDRLSGQIAVTDRTASMSVGRVKYSNTLHYANKASFPAVGRSDTLYYADDTGTAYIYIPEAHFYAPADVDEYGNANYIKAGEIVIAINENGDTEAKLDADVIYAGKNTKQTLAGLELPTWMNTTDGLIANHATILDVHAENIRTVTARCDTLETDYLKTKDLSSEIGKITGVLKVAHLQAQSYTWTPSSGEVKALTAAYDTVEKTVSGDDITLKFTKINGSSDSVTFSRATSLRGSWSGSTWKVTASPQNVSKSIGIGTSSADVNLSVSHGSASVFTNDQGDENKNYLSLPTYVQTIGDGAGGADTTRYTTTPAISITSLRESLSVTSNGTYTPSTGKVGFSEVSVNISASVSGSWSGGVYKVTANPGSNSRSVGFGGSPDVALSVSHGSASVFTNDQGVENKNYLSLPTYIESVGDATGGGNTTRYTTTPAVSISSLREELYVTSNGTYTPGTGKVGFSQVTVDVPTGGEISIPRGNIYTTDRLPSGTNASTLRNNYEQARSDGEYVVFQVTCGDASRWYYMEP